MGPSSKPATIQEHIVTGKLSLLSRAVHAIMGVHWVTDDIWIAGIA
jgi:hypothetical protein